MARQSYKRDALGRFAKSSHGGSVIGAVGGAAVGGALGSRALRKRIVPGSIRKESFVGTSKDGKWTGAKIGARYNAPAGRQVVVRGIVGISQKPTAKRNVRLTTDLDKRTTTVRIAPKASKKASKKASSRVKVATYKQAAGQKMPR